MLTRQEGGKETSVNSLCKLLGFSGQRGWVGSGIQKCRKMSRSSEVQYRAQRPCIFASSFSHYRVIINASTTGQARESRDRCSTFYKDGARTRAEFPLHPAVCPQLPSGPPAKREVNFTLQHMGASNSNICYCCCWRQCSKRNDQRRTICCPWGLRFAEKPLHEAVHHPVKGFALRVLPELLVQSSQSLKQRRRNG